MERLVLEVPVMYGDHHVVEVRRALLGVPGVESVYASSAFHVVEVAFDPERVSEETLRQALEEAGYLANLRMPLESSLPATQAAPFFRHSTAHEAVVAFGQAISREDGPDLPLPGMDREGG